MKVGEVVLYLHELGGQPHLMPVTITKLGIYCNQYDIINVEEFDGFIYPTDCYTKEMILSMFEKEKRQ